METASTETKPSQNSQVWEHIDTNLIKYVSTGGYYAKFKTNGKKTKVSLETDNLVIARRKLAATMHRLRGSPGSASGRGGTMSALLEDYKAWLENKVQSPRTREFRLECITDIQRNWPGFLLTKISRVTRHVIETWRDSMVTKHEYSHSRTNGCLGTLRQIFKLADGKGLLMVNPSLGVKGLPVKPKRLVLPNKEQFAALRAEVKKHSVEGFYLFELLHLSGCRIGSAHAFSWGDVDWAKERVYFGKAKRGAYTIPLFPSLRKFLEELKPATAKPADKVIAVASIKTTLGKSCRRLGIPHLSHHDLRHWFATRCIELGVDIPTLSRWLGHKDGGVLAMRVYGHLRDEHSQAMAQRL